MGHFMELFLDLSVLSLWPEGINESARAFLIVAGIEREIQDLLNTTWMQTCLVDAVWIDHLGE